MKLLRFLAVFVLLSSLFSGCNLPPSNSPTSTPETVSTQVIPTNLPQLTATSTLAPARVILVTPPGSGEAIKQDAQNSLNELAAAAGLVLTTVETLEPNQVTPDVKLVFYTSIPQNLPQVVAAAPQVQFAAVSPVDIDPVPNFNVIRLRPENQAFVAGWVSATTAPDWRVLGLIPPQDPPASSLVDAFHNGAQYFCGICNSYYAPVTRFPIVRLADSNNYQATIDEVNKNLIYLIYVAPEIGTPEVLRSLASKNFILVGGSTPPEDVRPRWAATVRENPVEAMKTLWPDMLAGQGGKILNASITIDDINPELFSEGKKNLALSVVDKLNRGLVYPFTPPLQ